MSLVLFGFTVIAWIVLIAFIAGVVRILWATRARGPEQEAVGDQTDCSPQGRINERGTI